MPKTLVAGNWKMNGVSATLCESAALSEALTGDPPACRVALFPPAALIHRMAETLARGPVEVGAQDCHAEAGGAYTGDLSAEMLHDAGARLVILGHSERRTRHRESDALIASKARAALRAGLEPIICVGERLEERRSGEAARVVRSQVEQSLPPELARAPFALAYEPVWAIGTGLTPTIGEIEAIHAVIAEVVQARFAGADAPILYGGSVNAANARGILSATGVGGALVGGASLKAADFLPIVRATG